MHKLNFCGTLCLPKSLQGFPTRGIDAVIEFERGFAVVMLGMETPYHLIYSSRPVLKNRPIPFEELMTINDIQKVKDAIAPDFALDPDPRADSCFENRDESIKKIIRILFAKGHKKVVIWSNNGIGNDVSDNGSADGVIRKDGIACSVRKDGSIFSHYQKRLPSTYQNSSHDHIHISPDEDGLYDSLLSALKINHSDSITDMSLECYRKKARESQDAFPCITIAVVDQDTDLDEPLRHTFFRAVDSRFEDDISVIGFTRRTVLSYSIKNGLKIDQEEVKKLFIKKAQEYYKES